ncbi:unnamed protein product [Vitrella brassicaformis CCMP3155]|uniref:Uncharacterized protein n=1 Tax=Vitrella brassicaformis (strain CCMP3155) TaxID=1169540 RepID=A0A0G4GZL3_VITBC|nr:unnamed protein product [Vitrella brassicaformis CCMP3155]|eukprot:CEM36600.1 unnamed protein product [Vitrella brassicaformis CCMP3155]
MTASAHGQPPHDFVPLEDVEILHSCMDPAPSNATRRLAEGIIYRTFTHQQQVTDLIQQHGARANASIELPMRGCSGGWAYYLLSLTIDNLSDNTMPTIAATDEAHTPGAIRQRPVILPRWPSPQLEAAIMNALIDSGADVNGPAGGEQLPIRIAIRAGNEGALSVLLARNAAVRWNDHRHPTVMDLPHTGEHLGYKVPPAYEQRLLSVYRRLIQHDPTLATVQDHIGRNLIHSAAHDERWNYSQAFIDSYLDLLVANGANPMAMSTNGWTALHDAAYIWENELDDPYDSSPCVVDYVGRHVPAEFVNREIHGGETALSLAAEQLEWAIAVPQDDDADQYIRERATRKIPLHEATIRNLLRCGADISFLANRPPSPYIYISYLANRPPPRELVLPQYTAVLNEVPAAAMAAVNAALRPQRSLAALLTHLLPHVAHNDGEDPAPSPLSFGPHESAAIGWKIAAFCLDMEAAHEAITRTLTVRNSDFARRVCGAVERFVKSALSASGNQEVVGGTANVDGVTVRVPLQCFAVNGGQQGGHRMVGVREVVHRARLDEAARHGIEGASIAKGFNEQLANADCQFLWQQLRRVDGRGRFVTLDIN